MPLGSSFGYTGCDVITAATPAPIASMNGGRCVERISSGVESIVGSWNRRHGSAIANGTLNVANTMFGAFFFWVAWHWVPMFGFAF